MEWVSARDMDIETARQLCPHIYETSAKSKGKPEYSVMNRPATQVIFLNFHLFCPRRVARVVMLDERACEFKPSPHGNCLRLKRILRSVDSIMRYYVHMSERSRRYRDLLNLNLMQTLYPCISHPEVTSNKLLVLKVSAYMEWIQAAVV
jgi:hypothetical protein